MDYDVRLLKWQNKRWNNARQYGRYTPIWKEKHLWERFTSGF